MALAGVKLRKVSTLRSSPAKRAQIQTLKKDYLILIGSSTGGLPVVEDILSQLPEDFPCPIVIAQHMPPTFTKSFAERLDKVCAIRVREVDSPLELKAGCAYVGKGGTDVVIGKRMGKLYIFPKPENPKYNWHPYVEALGKSALEWVNPKKIVAILLTGMGYDGAEAFTEIKRR